jgi:murein DD-endopeptidase MepM/ murein hydrolase activator NlpD
MFRRLEPPRPPPSFAQQFGLHSAAQVARDVGTILARMGDRPVLNLSVFGFFRPDLSLPAYAGFLPEDGVSPIYHFFDRVSGGRAYRGIVTRDRCADHRGGRLTYDEHDGTDFVCPVGTPLACAAPGVVVAVRESFLRGGITASVDHGHGVMTQYTHLSRMVAEVGEPLPRGGTVALSGSAGLDMLSGFPWVPPHVHFMVWVRGRPVDPYLAAGEAAREGTWAHGNDPRTSGAMAGDAKPLDLGELPVEEGVVEAIAGRCLVPAVREELERARTAGERLAVLEDSLHHERDAWPEGIDVGACRPESDATQVKLTLPLPVSLYRSARAADVRRTAPPRG